MPCWLQYVKKCVRFSHLIGFYSLWCTFYNVLTYTTPHWNELKTNPWPTKWSLDIVVALRTNFGPPHLPFKTVRGNPGAGHSGGGWCGSTPATIHSYQPASCSPTGYSEARTLLATSGLAWLRLSNTGNMFTLSELVVLMAVLSATASGYFVSIDAHAEECFYERVNSGTKMGLMFEVAEGGFLDIDVEVKQNLMKLWQ